MSDPETLPFARPYIDESMVAALAETLRSRWLASGPRVAEFEIALGSYVGGRPVRTFNSATSALQVALELIGIGPQDEVITPAQSFFATANVIERVGARPIFVDVDLSTRNIDMAQAHAAVTDRTRALLPVHYNAPLDPQALDEFRTRHGVRVVEDAALAIGSRVDGQPVGSSGDLVAFSFHPNKNMTTIEGGALCLSDPAEVEMAERLRFHGIVRQPDGARDVVLAGGKFNLSDVSARLGILQLEYLDTWCATRAALAEHYFQCIEAEAILPASCLPPRVNPGHSWNLFTILLPGSESADVPAMPRPEFMAAMQARGINTGISYEALHLTTHQQGRENRAGEFPIAERIGRDTVSLPLFVEMSRGDVERVCETMVEVFRARRG